MRFHDPLSQLFPYTTLFRSWWRSLAERHECGSVTRQFFPYQFSVGCCALSITKTFSVPSPGTRRNPHCSRTAVDSDGPARSEEHTSELQSQSNLVCRLLLEK